MKNTKSHLLKSFLICFFLFISNFSKAQTPIFTWAKAIGGTDFKSSNDIALDKQNNIYTAGQFKGTVDFDPETSVFNLSSFGNDDVFVTKLNNQGQLIWAKKIGGTNKDIAKAIAIDSLGYIYIAGSFTGTADFNPGAGTFNLSAGVYVNSFICKLDSNGIFVWAKKLSNNYNEALDVALDADGNCYFTGYFNYTVDFDPNAGVYNLIAQSFESDAFVLKLDNAGNLIWAKAFSGLNDEYGYGIDVDYAGNVFTTGNFNGTVDFDPSINTYNLTSTNVTTRDIFITKLDTSGNFLWAHSFGDSLDDIGYKIAVDSIGNSYTIGRFYDTIDFDPGIGIYQLITNQGSGNGFILKLNPSGALVWANGIVGLGDVTLLDINLDNINNIYVTGNLAYTADFDPSSATYNLTTNGGYDLIIAKYDNTGSLDWAKNMGGYIPNSGGASGNGIVTDEFSNVYITGGFSATMDFDPSINVYNLTTVLPNIGDMFVLKLGPCTPSSYTQSFTLCSGSGITVGNNTYYTSGVYIDTLPNATGCDSIINTNITLYPTYDSTQTIYLCAGDSVLIDGNYIDSTCIYVQNIIDANGCNNSITSYVNVYQTLNTNVTINNNNLVANYPPLGGVTYQWIDCNSLTPIIGETNAVFTPIIDGNYAVLVSNSNCSDTSDCVNFTITGLGLPNIDKFKATIYPNPTNGIFTIEINNSFSGGSYTFFDNLGRQILKGPLLQKKTMIDINNITRGIYHLKILDNFGNQRTIKLIKK
jgi:hypothetical protein